MAMRMYNTMAFRSISIVVVADTVALWRVTALSRFLKHRTNVRGVGERMQAEDSIVHNEGLLV